MVWLSTWLYNSVDCNSADSVDVIITLDWISFEWTESVQWKLESI